MIIAPLTEAGIREATKTAEALTKLFTMLGSTKKQEEHQVEASKNLITEMDKILKNG